MGHAIIRITPEIILELIASGYLVADHETQRTAIDIPADSQISRIWYEGEIAPVGEISIALEHEALWRIAPGGVIPTLAIKVNK